MRIVVVGAGVLGSLYGARLTGAGHDVTLVARGRRLSELRAGSIRICNDADGRSISETVEAIPFLPPERAFDLALVTVRADQIEALLPELTINRGVKVFVFMHNRAAGAAPLVRAVGAERVLLGFPGASGRWDAGAVRYRLIREQPTTLGELDGSLSPRLRQLASLFEAAGFEVALGRRMEAWLTTHALFVTAIAGAIYSADSHVATLAASRPGIRTMVRGIRQGFHALTAAGLSIEPLKLRVLFSLPSMLPEAYWRRYLARPSAELLFERHARAAPLEMWTLVGELRQITRFAPGSARDLDALWTAVSTAAAAAPVVAAPDVISDRATHGG